MKTRLIAALLLISSFAVAQTDSTTNDILTTRKFRVGIFKTFAEFMTNSPTIQSGFKIKADSSLFDRYELFFDNGKKVRKFYAFSDGTDLYMNAKVYGQSNYFVKILILGPICYLEDKRGKANTLFKRMASAGASGGLIGGAIAGALSANYSDHQATENPGWMLYLPDEDGNAYFLDRKSLQSVFKETNPELYKKFLAEKDRDKYDLLLKYLVQYNDEYAGRKKM